MHSAAVRVPEGVCHPQSRPAFTVVRCSTYRRIRRSAPSLISPAAEAALNRVRQSRSTLAGSARTTVLRLELAVVGASNWLICRPAGCRNETAAISWAKARNAGRGSTGTEPNSRTARTRSAWYASTSSTAIASLDSKWWYRLPARIPDAAATSRMEVFVYPSEAKSPAATWPLSGRAAPFRASRGPSPAVSWVTTGSGLART